MPVIYIFNFRNYTTWYTFSNWYFKWFCNFVFVFEKRLNEPLCLGTNVLYFYVTITYIHNLWYYKQRLILSNGNKVNRGPKLDSWQNFTICHWNLNGITAHTFSKAYLTIHKTGFVCLSETYLDFLFPVNDENLVIQGYKLVRWHHPTNSKRREVCIYYKGSLPLKIIDIQYLQECINFCLTIDDNLCCLMPLSIIENCFKKKQLKSSAFPLKSVISLLPWNKGGIHRIFLPFRHLFKFD